MISVSRRYQFPTNPAFIVLTVCSIIAYNMEYMKDDFPSKFEPRKRFRVIVVGAGISGLATAFGNRRWILDQSVRADV